MTQHDKARELVQRQRQIAILHRWFCASETDTIRGPAIMSFGEHARLAADADAAADLITAQAEENQRLREALEPFAAIADLFDSEVEGHSDTDELSLFYGDGANWLADRFTLAQFNAARAVLRSTEASND